MMYGFVLFIHVLVSLVLIGVILIQGGRGGLSEALGGAAAQSLFGSSAATVMTRITTFCASLFVVTCLSLAYLSTVKGRSVIEQVPVVSPETALPILPAQPGSLAPTDGGIPTPQTSPAPQGGTSPPAESPVQTTQPSDASPSQ